ncbi:hypothetical protein TCT1_09490 [Xenorhabdus sp. TCT-1]|uniref:Rhs element Vgr family protein n=1 Tax=Xenorhabdus taiwanensis TaxID=3085177 RepID=A0ABN7C1Q7_9GAMM|nr:hypothetical protein TCT1_09490 [Xenorhabdus sp. TCT-1]
MAQGWNGNGFGFMAIPRIGQEVIVSYLNGDIDRPIVTGSVYNAVNRPPLDLPAAKTRTTFKTKTHKGEGFNELRFEDAKGSEEVFIHAQKDMKTTVLNNRETHVLASHSETVEKNQTINVFEHKEEDIGITHTHTVGESLAITVGDVIELRCGSSCLRMDKFGNVTIQGTKFLFDAADAIQISAQDIDLN